MSQETHLQTPQHLQNPHQNPHKDVQRHSYHTPRFYKPEQTPKQDIQGSAWEVIYNHISYFHKVDLAYIELGCAVLWVESSEIFPVLQRLKSLGYEVLSEMSAIDKLALDSSDFSESSIFGEKGYIKSAGKFELFYQLHSLDSSYADKRRIRIKCTLEEGEKIESIHCLFALALWSEREIYDMFGIRFLNHPKLSRLLMPRDWVGHPLLRSYPLQGDENASWYEVDKIFGKQYREIIGAEQRDSARIDESEVRNFAKIDEIGKSSDPLYMQASKTLFVRNISKEKKEILQKRK
ncbi:NADH-quinone oxidoreductase subunit C [Helicobacter sp. T3_23-1056]